MTSSVCSEYEWITTSYLSSVLELNIHKISKGIERSRHYHTSGLSSNHFNGENFNVIFQTPICSLAKPSIIRGSKIDSNCVSTTFSKLESLFDRSGAAILITITIASTNR